MNRSTLILFILLLALGAVAYFLIPSSEERESSDKAPAVAFAVDSGSVIKIALVRAGRPMTLENVGGKWMITSPAKYPADGASVLQLLQGLSRFKVGSLISSNPEKQKLFQVDSSGTEITVTDRSGKEDAMIIGKMGPSFSEVYCRPPGSKNVFLGEGLDSWSVTKDVKEWRDKSIAAVPSESVKGLSYALNSRQFDYVRDSTTWKMGESIVDNAVMNPPLTTLANLRADDFVDTAMRFSTQPVTVTVKGASGLSLQLYPSQPDSSRYYVQSSNSQQLYVINKYTAQQLMKPVDHSRPAQKSPFARKEETKQAPPVAATTTHKAAAVPPPQKPPAQPPAKTQATPEKSVAQPPSKEPPSATSTGGAAVITEKKTPSAPPPDVTKQSTAKKTGAAAAVETGAAPKKETPQQPKETAAPAATEKAKPSASTSADDEGDLTVYTVKAADTMPLIAKKYNCSVEQILKWNLLKSINVKPGQELYIYVKK